MRRKTRNHSPRPFTKEVQFFSICTNGTFPDTLDIDRMYEPVAGSSCIALPLPLIKRAVRAAHEPPTESICAGRHDGWRATIHDAPFQSSRERIELAFPAIARQLAADERHSAQEASSPGSEAPDSHDGSNLSEMTCRQRCTWSFPSDTAGSRRLKRRSPQPRFLRYGPRLTGLEPRAERPVRNQNRQDQSSPPPHRPSVKSSSEPTRQLGAASSEPL
jgi:hypothetical protein